MLRRFLYTLLSIIALNTASYAQVGYKLDLDACVYRDSLFIDFLVTDTLAGGPLWALSGSNFVVDITDASGGVGSGISSLDFYQKVLTYEGPWSASQNAPDYIDMGLGAAVDSFLNVTINDDEANGAGGYQLVKDSMYIIATVAIPLKAGVCGDTIFLKWRYKNRGADHTWPGKSIGMGSGYIREWGTPIDSNIQQYGTFNDLNYLVLCDCGITNTAYTLTADSAVCVGDTVTYTLSPYSPGDSVKLYKLGDAVPFAAFADSVYKDTLNGPNDVYAYVHSASCSGCGSYSDTTSLLTSNIPTPVITNGNDTLCVGDSIRLSVQPQNPLFTYAWYNLINDTLSTDTFYYAKTRDSIIVSLTNTVGCTGYDTTFIDTTSIAGSILYADTFYCAGDSLILYTTSTSAKIWTFNSLAGPIVGSTDTLMVKAIGDGGNGPGTYYLALGGGACSSVDSVEITEDSCSIFASFTKSADTICLGSSVTYTSTSTGDTARVWDFGPSYPNDTAVGPISITYTTVGWNYTDLTVFGPGGFDEAFDSVYVLGITQKPDPSLSIVVSDSIAFDWPVVPGATSYTVSYNVNSSGWVNNSTTNNFFELGGLNSLDSVCFYVTAVSTCNSTVSDTTCLQTGASNCDISFNVVNPSDICIGDSVCFALNNIVLPTTQPDTLAWKISWEGQALVRDQTYCTLPSGPGPGQIEFTIVDTTTGENCYSNGFLNYTVNDTLSSDYVSVGVGKVSKTKVTFNWLSVPGATAYVVDVTDPGCYTGPGAATPDTVTGTNFEVKLTDGCTGAEINNGLDVGILVSAYNPCDSIGMQRDTVTAPATDSCYIGFVKSPDLNSGCEGDTTDIYVTKVVISYQGNNYYSGFEVDWYNTGTYEPLNDTDYVAVPGTPGSTEVIPFTIRADSVNTACPVAQDTIRITTAPSLDPSWEVKTNYCLTDVRYQLNLDVATVGGTFSGTGVIQDGDDWFFDPSTAGVGTFFVTTHHVCGADSSLPFMVSDVPCVSTVFSQLEGRPDGIYTTCDGEVYFSLPGQNSIWKLDTNGVPSKILGDSSIRADFDGHVSVARVNEPRGLVVNETTKDIYFVDSKNHKIKKYIDSTREVITITGSSTNPSYVDSDWGASRFDLPWGMTADCDLNYLYVTDRNNSAVRTIEVPDGGLNAGPVFNVSTLFGGNNGFQLGVTTGAMASMSIGIGHPTLDGDVIYVPDANNKIILRYDMALDQASPFMQITFPGFADGINTPNGLAASDAKTAYPVGTAIQSGQDWIYFADRDNYAIRTMSSDDTVRTVAGKDPDSTVLYANESGNAGGSPLTARFGEVTAMRYGADGHLYVCDQTVSSPKIGSIRKIAFDRNVYGPFALWDSVYCLFEADTIIPPHTGGIYAITSGNPASLDTIGVDSFVFNPVDTGWYTLSYKGTSECCPVSDTFRLYVIGAPVVALADTTPTCDSNSTLLDAGTMPDWESYQWFPKDSVPLAGDTFQTYTATDTGYFIVEVTDTNGCSTFDTTNVQFSAPTSISIASNVADGDSLCLGTFVQMSIDTVGLLRWGWNTGDSTATIFADSIFGSGEYIVTAEDNGGCVVSDSFSITYRNLPFVCINAAVDTLYGTWNVSTLAGNGNSGLVNAIGLNAEFDAVWDVHVNRRGTGLIVSEEGVNNVLRGIRLSDTMVVTLAGTPTVFGGDVDGPVGSAEFNHPYGVFQDMDGNVLFADRNNHVIKKIDASFTAVTTISGINGAAAALFNGTDSATYNSPFDLTGDVFGNIYVADFSNHWLRHLDTVSGVVNVFAGNTANANSSVDGKGFTPAAGFNWPNCIDRDFEGNLYNTDNGSGLVRRTDRDSVFTTIASGFSNPWGITVDPMGVAYVVEYGTHTVHAIYPNGSSEIIAGQSGSPGYLDGLVGTQALFSSPRGIDYDDRSGTLYLADYGNDRIRSLAKNKTIYMCQGQVDTLDGSCSVADSMRWVEVTTGTVYPAGPRIPVSTSGTYVLYVMKDGCMNSDTVFVVANPAPSVNINGLTPGTLDTLYGCIGDTIMLFDTVGSNELFTWTSAVPFIGGINDTTIWVDSSGRYILDVVDTVGGCSGTDTIDVIFSPKPVFDLGNDTGSCVAGSSIVFDLSSLGVDSVVWNGSVNNTSYTANTPGLDTITVEVYNGTCIARDTVHVGLGGPITTQTTDHLDVCPGNIGDIGGAPTASGGTTGSAFHYAWSPNTAWISDTTVSNPSVTFDTSRIYYLLVTDTIAGCTARDSSIITTIPGASFLNIGSDTVLCYGDSNKYSVGNIPGFHFWSWEIYFSSFVPNGTQVDVLKDEITFYQGSVGLPDSLLPHSLALVVWDPFSAPCIISDTARITFAAPIVVNAGPDTTICYKDTFMLGGAPTATGGLEAFGSAFSYTWYDTLGNVIDSVANPIVVLDHDTVFLVEVRDSLAPCGEWDSIRIRVTQPQNYTLRPNAIICQRDSIELYATFSDTTGLGFTWISRSNEYIVDSSQLSTYTFPVDSPSVFFLQVLDTSGCNIISDDSVVVLVNPLPFADFTADTVCDGNNTTFTDLSTDAVSWLWLLGDTNSVGRNIQNFAYGYDTLNVDTCYNVYLRVANSYGCFDDTTKPVCINSNPYANAGPNDTICPNLTLTIGGSPSGWGGNGSLTYAWTTDSNSSLNDTSLANPVATPVTIPPNNLVPFNLLVTDSIGCFATDQMIVNVIDLLATGGGAEAGGGLNDTLFVCKNDSAVLGGLPPDSTASGGKPPYTFNWYELSPVFGSTTDLSSTVIPNPNQFSSDSITSYVIEVRDAQSCRDTDVVVVVKVDYPTFALSDTAYCEGGSDTLARGVILDSNYSYKYQWFPTGFLSNANILNPITTTPSDTTYILTVTNLDVGCVFRDTINIDIQNLPPVNAGLNDSMCVSNPYTLLADSIANALTYQWTMNPPGAGTLQTDSSINPVFTPAILDSVTFTLTVVDSNFCVDSDSVKLYIQDTVTAWLDTTSRICANSVFSFVNDSVSGQGASILWTTSGTGVFDTSNTILHPTYIPGADSGGVWIYLSASNSPCPSAIDSVFLDVADAPNADYTPVPHEVFLNEDVFFANYDSTGETFIWVIKGDTTILTTSGGVTTITEQYSVAGFDSTTLILENQYGCRDTAYYEVGIIGTQVIYVPNVFAPSSNNVKNSTLRVFGTNVLDTPFDFKIFNRWGEKIFESSSFDFMNTTGWDATHEGTGDPQDIGVYTYMLSGQFEDGTEFEKVGNVTLVR